MDHATPSTGTTQLALPADFLCTVLQLAASEPHTIDEAMATLSAIEDRMAGMLD